MAKKLTLGQHVAMLESRVRDIEHAVTVLQDRAVILEAAAKKYLKMLRQAGGVDE